MNVKTVKYNRPIIDLNLPRRQAKLDKLGNQRLVALRKSNHKVVDYLRIVLAYRKAPIGAGIFRSGMLGYYKVKANTRHGMLGFFELLTFEIPEKSFPFAIKSQVNEIYSRVGCLMAELKREVSKKIDIDSLLIRYLMDVSFTDRSVLQSQEYKDKMSSACNGHCWKTINILKKVDHELDELLALFGLTVESKI